MKKVLSLTVRCNAEYAAFLQSRLPNLGYPYSASYHSDPFDKTLFHIYHFNYSNQY